MQLARPNRAKLLFDGLKWTRDICTGQHDVIVQIVLAYIGWIAS
jgi:hypothetical protein